MARDEQMERIPPSSPVYQEVARLYRWSRQIRPGGVDRWNGELYARFDDTWAGLGRDGTLRLNDALVLRHLTGGRPSPDPARQAQALVSVLHESYHARVEFDARAEPNALRQPESVGLDEGLTELAAIRDFRVFANRAGYAATPQAVAEYPSALHAASALLEQAAKDPSERAQLLGSALDSAVMMRWDKIADHIVRNDLAVVPPAQHHQQAARAHLVRRMAVPGWRIVHRQPSAGPPVAAETSAALDRACREIEQHYRDSPGTPYPARSPNAEAGQQIGASEEPAELQVLGGQAPAAQATRQQPVLGDGGRGGSRPATSPVRGATRQPSRNGGRD